MMIDAAVSILAGLGLFFVGVKGLRANLGQLAGRSLRRWVARSTDSYLLSALIGAVSGALTQSTNAVTAILMSLTAADLITVPKAKPILAWANVGAALLVFLAAVNLHLLVYALLGATGFCFYLNLDRSARWRLLVSAVLALSQLLLGIGLMHSGSSELRQINELQQFFRASAQAMGPALIVGAVLAFVAQSGSTVSVLTVALVSARLLNFEQAMVTVYGANIGSACATYTVATKIRGSARQLAIFQLFIKLAGVGLLILLYLIERFFGVPLVAAGIRALTADPGHEVAFVFLACQIGAVTVQLVLGAPLQPLLDRLSPPEPQEILGKPRYLYDQALEEPETALTLVDREEARLFALLPLYFGLDEHFGAERVMLERPAILAAAQGLGRSIGDFLADLTDSGAERRVLEAISARQARNSLLVSIHESLADLAAQLAVPLESPALRMLADQLREGLGALLLTAEEAVRSLDPAEIALMRQLTGDRDGLVDRLRHSAIAADQGLTPADHRQLYTITSLFELIVWMLRRYSAMLAPPAQTAMATQSDNPPLAAEVLRPS